MARLGPAPRAAPDASRRDASTNVTHVTTVTTCGNVVTIACPGDVGDVTILLR